jgi:hypothetical protein
MTVIRRYPLGPYQQALLAALVGSPLPIPTEPSSASDNPGSLDKPTEVSTHFEDHRNHGIGE